MSIAKFTAGSSHLRPVPTSDPRLLLTLGDQVGPQLRWVYETWLNLSWGIMPDLVSWWQSYLHGSFITFPVSSSSLSLTWILALACCICIVCEERTKRWLTWQPFSTWMSYQQARLDSESKPCCPSVGLGEDTSLHFMEYIKLKFMHKPHNLPTSLHCLHHELFSHAVDILQVSGILLWKHGMDN